MPPTHPSSHRFAHLCFPTRKLGWELERGIEKPVVHRSDLDGDHLPGFVTAGGKFFGLCVGIGQLELGLGLLRGRILVPADSPEEFVREQALAEPKVAAALIGKEVVKAIVVPGKLVNIVVR